MFIIRTLLAFQFASMLYCIFVLKDYTVLLTPGLFGFEDGIYVPYIYLLAPSILSCVSLSFKITKLTKFIGYISQFYLASLTIIVILDGLVSLALMFAVVENEILKLSIFFLLKAISFLVLVISLFIALIYKKASLADLPHIEHLTKG